MKVNNTKKRTQSGFTLIEMIGVLAVIAILAAVLIPKIFEAINNSRVNNAAMSCQTVKTGIADHYAKFGSLTSSNGITIAAGTGELLNFDRVLVSEGFIDKPFAVKISAATTNHAEVAVALSAVTAPDAANAAYNLDGTGPVNDATGSAVAQCIIYGVNDNDAKEFNDRVDGPALGVGLGAADLVGRVKYDAVGVDGITDVYVYLTHR